MVLGILAEEVHLAGNHLRDVDSALVYSKGDCSGLLEVLAAQADTC